MIRISRTQRQRGGARSQQIQVARDLVLGINEERATEIAREQSLIAIREFTAEGAIEASARIEKFDEKVVDDLAARGLPRPFQDHDVSPRMVKGRSMERPAHRVASVTSMRPARRSAPIARLRRAAMTLGPDRVLTLDLSS